MKIAVFSDVHGNLKELKAVLEQIKEKNADLTVFLGDIFQRGNEETECLELLKDNEIICLKGNCELYLEHGVDIDSAYPFLQLSDLKNGVFDKVCKSEDVMKYELVVVGHSHQNFVKGNVVSVSASGLEGASYLLIEVNEDDVSFEHISID